MTRVTELTSGMIKENRWNYSRDILSRKCILKRRSMNRSMLSVWWA